MGKLSKLFKGRTVSSKEEEAVMLDDALSVLNQVSANEDAGKNSGKKDEELGELEHINMSICHSLSINR